VAVAVLVVFCGTVVWLGREATHVHYDTNLLNMQARGTEAVRAQERIQEKSDDSLLYAVSLAKNRQTALALKQRYEKLPTVSRVEEIASLFPPAPTAERTELIAGIARAATMLAQIHPASPNPGKIGEALDEVYTAIVNTQDPAVAATAQQLNTFLDRLSSLPLNEQVAALTPGGAAAAQLESVANTDPAPVTLKDLPASFTSRFVSHDKQWLLKIYPRDAVWEGAPLKKFVEEVRTVDPEVTGTPLQNYEASQSIWNSYLQAGLYALIAVLILLVWDFRTVHETLLAISPAGIALLVTLGVLGQWNIPLNPANMIMLPLLLGLGVDGGVHVLHDYRAQVGGYSISRSTARSLFLTAMTSIVGFGSLMVASHRGLFSLGFVLTVGVTAALVTSLVALPALLTLVTPGLPPAVSAAAPPILEEAEHDSEALKWRQPA
jgi:predicted RND superfamily exporter protein